MKILYSKKFKKQFQKLKRGENKKFEERINIFIKNPSAKILENHILHGQLSKYRSINISGNLRLLYEEIDDETVLFSILDTHSNLYS